MHISRIHIRTSLQQQQGGRHVLIQPAAGGNVQRSLFEVIDGVDQRPTIQQRRYDLLGRERMRTTGDDVKWRPSKHVEECHVGPTVEKKQNNLGACEFDGQVEGRLTIPRRLVDVGPTVEEDS